MSANFEVPIMCRRCRKVTEWDDDGLCDKCGFKEYFSEVGCRKCGKGGLWRIFTDDGTSFPVAECGNCGHQVEMPAPTVNETDKEVFDLRFFT